MPKYYTRCTRDIVRKIQLQPLMSVTIRTGRVEEIAPARTIDLPLKEGTVSAHSTKKARDAFMAAINVGHPGAIVTEES
jgi:hypothetical protein